MQKICQTARTRGPLASFGIIHGHNVIVAVSVQRINIGGITWVCGHLNKEIAEIRTAVLYLSIICSCPFALHNATR